MLTTMVYDHADRLRSYELVARRSRRPLVLTPGDPPPAICKAGSTWTSVVWLTQPGALPAGPRGQPVPVRARDTPAACRCPRCGSCGTSAGCPGRCVDRVDLVVPVPQPQPHRPAATVAAARASAGSGRRVGRGRRAGGAPVDRSPWSLQRPRPGSVLRGPTVAARRSGPRAGARRVRSGAAVGPRRRPGAAGGLDAGRPRAARTARGTPEVGLAVELGLASGLPGLAA